MTADAPPGPRPFLLASLLWLVVGVAMGGFFATNPGFRALKHTGHDFELVFASVHSHINLLGWLSNALFALVYWVLPRVFSRPLYSPRLAAWHFWLLNVGLAGMMAALFAGGVAGARVLIAGRESPDPGAALYGPGNAYLPYEAFLSLLRWGIPFAVLVLLGAGAFAANVWLTFGLRPSLARLANRARERFPLPARLAGLAAVPEEGPVEHPALKWMLKVAALWLVAGILLGGLYGSPPMFRWLKEGGFDFESMFASVHSHMTVMGWLGGGLLAVLFGVALLENRPPPARGLRVFLWLYNLGLLGLLAFLAVAAYQGRAAFVGATGDLTEAERFHPFEVSQGVLRFALPFALLFAAGLAAAVAALWRRLPGDPWAARFLRAGMAWLAAGLALEGILSLDPIYFWLVRSGHEFTIMQVVVKDHMVMLGGLSGIAFGLLYGLVPRLSPGRGGTPSPSPLPSAGPPPPPSRMWNPGLVAAHFWLLNIGLGGFLLFYAWGGYAGGGVFQTASNPYGPGGYLPYLAALDVTRFGTPFALALAASLILFFIHTWRIWPRDPPEER
ncbi:MAG: cbb3-type cytochrome c oxidase subunit I [Halobacteria archaeon]